MRCIKALILPLLFATLVGCTHGTALNRISVGMTKAQVIEELGEPASVAAYNGVETMRYDFWKDFWQRSPGDYKSEYYVRIVAGKVQSYGRMGDFDSTKDPTHNINIHNR
jgi:hypothetical protein